MIPLRAIRPKWQCQQTGDCCRAVGTVLMTVEEQLEILRFIPTAKAATLTWMPADGFVRLLAHPCPLLQENNQCGVYAVRPYNCRRWGCFRADAAVEPLEPDHGFLGCANARDRFHQDRGVRRAMERMQRKAQVWARAHGWKDDESARHTAKDAPQP